MATGIHQNRGGERPGELRLGDRSGSLFIASPPGEPLVLTIDEKVAGGSLLASWQAGDKGSALAVVAGLLRRLGAREVSTAGRPSDLDEALTLVLAAADEWRRSEDDTKVAAYRTIVLERRREREPHFDRDVPPPAWATLSTRERDDWRGYYADALAGVAAAQGATDG